MKKIFFLLIALFAITEVSGNVWKEMGVLQSDSEVSINSLVIANTEFSYSNPDETSDLDPNEDDVSPYSCLATKKFHLHRELNDRISEENLGINKLHYTDQFDLKKLVETHFINSDLGGTDQKVDEDQFSSLNMAYRFYPIDYTRNNIPVSETQFLTLTGKDELGYYNGIGYFNVVTGNTVGGETVYEKVMGDNPFGGAYKLANKSSVGHRPIVRVELYCKDNPEQVYAVGYLKLEISEIIYKEAETCDDFYTCKDVIVANVDGSEADNAIQVTWDEIQSKLCDLNGGDGIMPREWNTYEVVEGEQYVYDDATDELVLINKPYSTVFPYFSFGQLSVTEENLNVGRLNFLEWSFSTDDYNNLFNDLKTRDNGIDWSTRTNKVAVKRYYKLQSPDSSLPDLYFGFIIPAGKLQFDGVEVSKLARLQTLSNQCVNYRDNTLAQHWAELFGKKEIISSHRTCIDSAADQIWRIVNQFKAVSDGYCLSVSNGQNVTWKVIENLEYDWGNIVEYINYAVEYMGYYLDSFNITCSSGGSVIIDENFSVTGNTKTIYGLYSKAFAINVTPLPILDSGDLGSISLKFPDPIELSVIPAEGYRVKSFLWNGIEQEEQEEYRYLMDFDLLAFDKLIVEFEPDHIANVLEVEDASVVQGGWVTIPISMTNENDITAFQFELELPEGFSVQDAALTSRKSNQTMSYTQMTNGNYQFAAFSLNAKAFSGNEGTLVNLMLKASSTVSPGDYAIKVKNIELTTTDEQACKPSSRWATLTVKNIRVGDANGDGNISITDAVAVVNKVLGKPSTAFREEAADVNGDGRITITDAVAIVNIVLGKRSANARVGEPQ